MVFRMRSSVFYHPENASFVPWEFRGTKGTKKCPSSVWGTKLFFIKFSVGNCIAL